jgi:hypothetical protein
MEMSNPLPIERLTKYFFLSYQHLLHLRFELAKFKKNHQNGLIKLALSLKIIILVILVVLAPMSSLTNLILLRFQQLK